MADHLSEPDEMTLRTLAIIEDTTVAEQRRIALAAYERSDIFRPGVERHKASTGFRAWRSFSAGDPRAFVVVAHYDHGQHETEESWAAHVKTAQRAVMRYADAIVMGGYVARIRFDRDDPCAFVFPKSAARRGDG